MARYRLRFLLQEFDLPRGATILGRSSDCHVTIEDPLVSRHHARIVLEGDRAVVYDLNSRNGVKVNGAAGEGARRAERRRPAPHRHPGARLLPGGGRPERLGQDHGLPAPLRALPDAVPARGRRLPELRRHRGARRGDAQRPVRSRGPADLERAAVSRGPRPRAHRSSASRTSIGSCAGRPSRSRSGSSVATPSTRPSSPSSPSAPPGPASRSTTRPGRVWVAQVYRRVPDRHARRGRGEARGARRPLPARHGRARSNSSRPTCGRSRRRPRKGRRSRRSSASVRRSRPFRCGAGSKPALS